MKNSDVAERDGRVSVQPRPWSLVFLGILAVVGGLGAIPAPIAALGVDRSLGKILYGGSLILFAFLSVVSQVRENDARDREQGRRHTELLQKLEALVSSQAEGTPERAVAERAEAAAAEIFGRRANMARFRFRYPAEKFGAANRALMLPHPNGEERSIADAYWEVMLGLRDVKEDDLDENARRWIATIRRLFDAEGIKDPRHRGTAILCAEQMTVEDRADFATAVNELASWFRRKFQEED